MTKAHGEVWWNELNTHAAGRARTFYEGVFGWQSAITALSDMGRPPKDGEASYTTFLKGPAPIGGAFSLDGPDMAGVPPHWLTYFAVDDAHAACAKVQALGGAVIREPFEVPGVGMIAIVKDPEGAVFGLGKPAKPAS